MAEPTPGRPLPVDPIEVEEVIDAARLPDDWDAVLVGDGSGGGKSTACGWGCVVFARGTPGFRPYAGGQDHGTVNFAEAAAYLAPLEALKAAKPTAAAWRVHVVTDSDYVRTLGNGGRQLAGSNPGAWAALDAYARFGLVLKFHHLGRNTTAANRYADALSKWARLLFVVTAPSAPSPEGGGA